ncbi:LysR family transcriptional regulator [Vibrio tubiashii]|uniref:LysR family transcriptional regulator n=1 Tax=Vibrio tubiashii TaxID=29498 RepID=UPI001EFC68A4|nr:LysR family transcriptional regulator [Vibrio tubiashii]MCG9577994.1 LysR family transcriptional regulator [Vibrio tubiashii]
MDKLISMKVFCHVAEQGNFRLTADYFSMSATMVGRHIKHLESLLNTPLIHRTTRKQTLTDSGRIYLKECQRILEDISNTESLIYDLQNKPKGTVKINAPVTFGTQALAPILSDFIIQYPDISVDLELDNSVIDPYKSEADFIIRIGQLKDSSLVARYLGDYELIYCASPDYLARHTKIIQLDDLTHHSCLGFRYHDISETPSTKSDSRQHIKLMANNGEVLRQAALKGVGVVMQPRILLEQDLKSGALEQVLESFPLPTKPIHLVYKDKQLSLKDRTLADYLLSALRP